MNETIKQGGRLFRFKTLLAGFTLLFLLAYLAWAAHGYYHRLLGFVRWHTHLMVYAYLLAAGLLLLTLFIRDKASDTFKNAFLVLVSVILTFFLIELYLEITGVNKTFWEHTLGRYGSAYIPQYKSHYHTWPTDSKEHWIRKQEYAIWRPTNSQGAGDREWEINKKPGEIRLLALGDSFTEGDGAPYDSSYVALLDRLLQADNRNVYVMNGGVCGSDPFHNYIHLRDKLLPYQPDIVIQTIASQDMLQEIIIKGGFERFQPNGELKFKEPPWWEPIYVVSYVSRLYLNRIGYNEFMQKNYSTPKVVQELDPKVIDLFRQYIDLCRKNKIKLVVVLRAEKSEILENKHAYDFTAIMNYLKSEQDVHVIDLLPLYRDYIKQKKSDAQDYFWKIDSHHNPKGYEMMANVIYTGILPVLDQESADITQAVPD